jgi:hypothetical protein
MTPAAQDKTAAASGGQPAFPQWRKDLRRLCGLGARFIKWTVAGGGFAVLAWVAIAIASLSPVISVGEPNVPASVNTITDKSLRRVMRKELDNLEWQLEHLPMPLGLLPSPPVRYKLESSEDENRRMEKDAYRNLRTSCPLA